MKAPRRGNRARCAAAWSDAVKIQRLILADIESPATKASVRAGCARAWEVLEERKRILRNRPLPGALRPVAKERKSKSRQVEPSFVRPPRETTNESTTAVSGQSTTDVSAIGSADAGQPQPGGPAAEPPATPAV